MVATGSALFWLLTGSPLIAILANLGVDLAGALPIIKKLFLDPASEDRAAWVLFSSGNIVNIFAVEKWVFMIAVYPIYMFLVCAAITTLTLRRSKKAG